MNVLVVLEMVQVRIVTAVRCVAVSIAAKLSLYDWFYFAVVACRGGLRVKLGLGVDCLCSGRQNVPVCSYGHTFHLFERIFLDTAGFSLSKTRPPVVWAQLHFESSSNFLLTWKH